MLLNLLRMAVGLETMRRPRCDWGIGACVNPFSVHILLILPTNPATYKGIGTAELRPSVRDPYLPRSVRTCPCACSAGYRMVLDDRERRTKEGYVSLTVAATSESSLAPAASRKGNG
jgi:hypothetical protein